MLDASDPIASQPLRRRPIPPARFLLKTPPIVEALEDFVSLIEFRDTGGFLAAPQRWGKTKAGLYLCAAVKQIFGSIPTVFVPLRGKIKRGANAFFTYLLNQARYRHARSSATRTETEIRNLFTDCVVSRARRSRHKMFILVIDEAQLLTIEQWEFLFNISNEADVQGVSLVVLSIGQPDLLDAESKLLEEGREEISERFLQRRLRFRGLLSVGDLKKVLEALERTRMPREGTLQLYLSQFCPKAIEGGWSLSMETEAIWNEFRSLYQEARVKVVELPMTYVMNAVHRLLAELSKLDAHGLQVPVGLHSRCVRGSGVIASITSTQRREKKLTSSQQQTK